MVVIDDFADDTHFTRKSQILHQLYIRGRHPRAYDGAVFDMLSGTGNFAFRQNTIHGGQPIAQFYSSTKVCTFHGDCQIPNMYNKTYVDVWIADIYNDTYIKTEIDTLMSNI